jgi:tRNA (cmo5U34)-methyltransferase
MIEKFKGHLEKESDSTIHVDVLCADVRDVTIEKASVVVLNFTLLFIPIEDRLILLEKIYQGLLPGGILIVSEKLKFEDLRQQELHTDLHHSFKKSQGYSDLEVSQKRSALDNVLLAETLPTHQQRLKQAGFSSTEVWFQYFNFASMIALK